MAIGARLANHKRRIAAAAAVGGLIDLSSGQAGRDDPAQGANWGPARTVRAQLLIELLTTDHVAGNDRPRAVNISGARIPGSLNLWSRTLVCPLLLRNCYIEEPVNLDAATAVWIRLSGCRIQGLSAAQLHTASNLELNDGFVSEGEVSLVGAHISGQLDLSGASLANPGGIALAADFLTVDHGVFCRNGFSAKGETHLSSAHISGQLDLDDASLTNPGGTALAAHGLTVDDSLLCRNGFNAEGEVDLVGARIGGQLGIRGARFANPGGLALNASSLTVTQDCFADDITAEGCTLLHGARFEGALSLTGARLANSGGDALAAIGLTVQHSMLCGMGFTAQGTVNISGAHIAGGLSFDGARLASPVPGREALIATGLAVVANMACRGMAAVGSVSLPGATIGGQLSFTGAFLANPAGPALDLSGATISELFLRPEQQPQGPVSLANATAGVFHDDRATWPSALALNGFTYRTFGNDQISPQDRLAWVKLHPGGYTPQIYDQLAECYRNAGLEGAARRVAIAKQRQRRSAVSPLNWLWYLTVGYGYRTWLAGMWLIGLTVLGTLIFAHAYPRQFSQAAGHHETFSPIGYTLDVLLPIVDLGQKSSWTPQGGAMYWSWALTGAGWVLATAVIAGLTSVLKRD
jgi:adhesin HecA-like repeat protein